MSTDLNPLMPNITPSVPCSEYSDTANHKAAINIHYLNIVHALKCAEKATIPSIPCSALKTFWKEYLDDLKQKSNILAFIMVQCQQASVQFNSTDKSITS